MIDYLLYDPDPNAILLRAAIWKLFISMLALMLITFWLFWLDKRLGINFKRHIWPAMRENPTNYMAMRWLGACILVGLVMAS